MPKTTQPHGRPRVGIVGAGQLALMMAEAASDLPIDLALLAAATTDPAVALVADHHIGSALSRDDVLAFGRHCDVLTVDHEVVNLDAVDTLGNDEVVIAPAPHALRFATDKAFQREEFAARGFPLPDHVVLRSLDALAINEFCSRHPRVVVKAARGGYDGRGVTVVEGDPTPLIRELLPHTDVVLEELLDLQGEIAVSVVTGRDGSTVTYPPVDTVQRNGMCDVVNVPSSVTDDLLEAAQQLARDVAEVVNAVGILAVEMFVTNGALLINEVATRPHNSGHWSIEGAVTSQFENHLRAVSGLSLGPTTPVAPYVTMVNIVGGENAPHWSELLSIEGIAVHEYRKANRPGRKLGHVTITSTDAMAHQQLVTRVRDILH